MQPDMLLSDIVAATTDVVGHKLTFLRNMVTENVGNLRTCAQVRRDRGDVNGHIFSQRALRTAIDVLPRPKSRGRVHSQQPENGRSLVGFRK